MVLDVQSRMNTPWNPLFKIQMLHSTVLCRLMHRIPHPAHISIDQDPGIQCLEEGSQRPHWKLLCVFSWAKAQHFILIPKRPTTNYKIFASSPVFVSESFFPPKFKLTGSCSICSNFELWDLLLQIRVFNQNPVPERFIFSTSMFLIWSFCLSPSFLPFISCKQSMGSHWL